MAGKKASESEVTADKKIEPYRDMLAKGELTAEQLAELAEVAEVTVADVERYVTRLQVQAVTPPPSGVDALHARLDERETALRELEQQLHEREKQLEEFEEALEKREAALRTLEVSVARGMSAQGRRSELRIRLTGAFTAEGPLPSGKLGKQHFGPSIYRGAMAELVLQRAKEQDKAHLIEVLPEE